MNYTIKEEKNSGREIEVTIDNATFVKYWDVAFKLVQKEVEIDGFRKGLAPESAIVGKYGESAILQEMANQAINTTYVDILVKEKLHVINEPHIHIVKLAKGEEFVYHAHVTVFPVIEISNYKEIAARIREEKSEITTDTTDEEIKNILNELSDDIKNSTEDLEGKIRENLKLEKENADKNIKRSKFLEEALKEVDEKHKDVWPAQFENRDKAQIIAVYIAKEEKLTASEEEIDAESIRLMNVIPKQDLISGKINESRLKDYAAQIIINEKMFKALDL